MQGKRQSRPKTVNHKNLTEKTGQIEESLFKMDYISNELILYNENDLYFLNLETGTGVILNMESFPLKYKEYILKNIIFSTSLHKKRPSVKNRTPNRGIPKKKHAKLEQIIAFLSSVSNNPFDLDEYIKMYNFSDGNYIDTDIKDKINYILKNYK